MGAKEQCSHDVTVTHPERSFTWDIRQGCAVKRRPISWVKGFMPERMCIISALPWLVNGGEGDRKKKRRERLHTRVEGHSDLLRGSCFRVPPSKTWGAVNCNQSELEADFHTKFHVMTRYILSYRTDWSLGSQVRAEGSCWKPELPIQVTGWQTNGPGHLAQAHKMLTPAH